MSQENNEENCVLVVDQKPSQLKDVESKSSRRAAEPKSPRNPRLPSIKSAKSSEPVKPIETVPDNKETKKPIKITEKQQDDEKKPPEYKENTKLEAKAEEQSINDKLADLQTHHRNIEFSDQPAGGLSRTGSRVSSVTRAVRRVFCCGAPNEPDEDRVSTERRYAV